MTTRDIIMITIKLSPTMKESITKLRARLDCASASIVSPYFAAALALLAATMAHSPVGQKQHKQERTAGSIQSRLRGVRLTIIGTTPGCVTGDVITWPWGLVTVLIAWILKTKWWF